jgi:hypothetical protein
VFCYGYFLKCTKERNYSLKRNVEITFFSSLKKPENFRGLLGILKEGSVRGENFLTFLEKNNSNTIIIIMCCISVVKEKKELFQ